MVEKESGTDEEQSDDEEDHNEQLVSHSDAAAALELDVRYVKQHSAATPTDVMYMRRWFNAASSKLFAILEALQFALGDERKYFLMCTNSLSSLHSIDTCFPQHPLVQWIHDLLGRLSEAGSRSTFVWLPSHVAIAGNELVDEAPKEAEPTIAMWSRPFSRQLTKGLPQYDLRRVTQVRQETSSSSRAAPLPKSSPLPKPDLQQKPEPSAEPLTQVRSTAISEPEIVPRPKQLFVPDTKAVLDVSKDEDDKLKIAISFDEMPGPEILKIMARIWSYLPLVSTQFTAGAMSYFINMLGANMTWNRAARPFSHMFEKYGPVVRLQGPFGGDIVFVNRPEHIETVYRQEGRYPVRSALDSLELYRLSYRKLRNSGPFMLSGPKWEDLRTKLETPLQRCIVQYCDHLDVIADEMVVRIQNLRSRQEEVPKNFYMEIYKWCLECIGLVAFNKRLGCLDEGLQPHSEAGHLMRSLLSATAALRKCEAGFQMWRFAETPSWCKLVKGCDDIDSILANHIKTAQENLQKRKELESNKEQQMDTETLPLLESLLLNEGLFPEDILTVLLDMLLIGVNSTAHAMSFLLYHLSKSPRIQRELYDEVLPILPYKDTKMTVRNIFKLRLLPACVKESLRLKPPIPVITRILPKDIALHCYRIPKGTYMLLASHVSSLREENFEDAYKFKPQRWLTDDQDIHPFAAIPFGHGPRSCVGRSLAELQLWMLTAKLVRNFRIEYHYGSINATARLMGVPDRPLRFTFVDRKN
ncbi:probable cytochrome P450 301a1, mitochondrial [Anabrus simplex]|uniref:probable cytochrome P450 301a1, mitochondrial n=1 Tax=Anabrus simplex TaxID=316456 RepID=UPI0035A27AD4